MSFAALVDRLAQPLRVHTPCARYAMPPARLTIRNANLRGFVSFLSTRVPPAGCLWVGPSWDSSSAHLCLCRVEALACPSWLRNEKGPGRGQGGDPNAELLRTYKTCFLASSQS